MPNPTSSQGSVKNAPLTMRKVEDQLLRERQNRVVNASPPPEITPGMKQPVFNASSIAQSNPSLRQSQPSEQD
jgi:hypothetical protein